MRGKSGLIGLTPAAGPDEGATGSVERSRRPRAASGGNGRTAGERRDPVAGQQIAAALRRRSAELASTIHASVLRAVPAPAADRNRMYRDSLQGAVSATIAYAIDVIEREGRNGCEPPWDALAHARCSARHGVSLGVVLRRFAATAVLLGQFVQEELERLAPRERPESPRAIRRIAEEAIEAVSEAVAGEYDLEYEEVRRTPEGRVSELVRRLLAGDGAGAELAAELGYEVHDASHLGLIATGEDAKDSIRRLSMALGCEQLVVRRNAGVHWVWLGTPTSLAVEDVASLVPAELLGEARLAIGEPGAGVEGWRLTHRQAVAAMRLGVRLGKRITRYAEDPLLAAGLQDDVLARSLQQIYLEPLGVPGTRKGAGLRETLRAYFSSRCNAASAAAALHVDRHTVERRLRTVEGLLGASPQSRQAELTIALRLEELERQSA
jgi:hypothetical protein